MIKHMSEITVGCVLSSRCLRNLSNQRIPVPQVAVAVHTCRFYSTAPYCIGINAPYTLTFPSHVHGLSSH